jgi:hypothetical protein
MKRDRSIAASGGGDTGRVTRDGRGTGYPASDRSPTTPFLTIPWTADARSPSGPWVFSRGVPELPSANEKALDQP